MNVNKKIIEFFSEYDIIKSGGLFMKRKIFWIIITVVVCIFVTFNYFTEFKSETFFAMDTIMSVKVTGSKKNLEFAENEIKRLDKIFSSYDTSGQLYKINKNKGGQVSPEMAEILNKSKEFYEKTEGAFDITLKNLKDLWAIKSATPKVPGNDEIKKMLEKSGVDKLAVSGENVTLNGGIQLDLGGIAKGYATDIIVKGLKERNVKKFVLDLGGNIYGFSENKPLNIGIQNPYGQRGDVLLTLEVADSAVVSSGGYERNFKVGDKVYHHILDPKTGYPAESGISQVTIVGKDSALCDAYSTAIYVMGREKAENLYEKSAEFEYIIVENNNIFVSEGLKDEVKNVNSDFKVIIS